MSTTKKSATIGVRVPEELKAELEQLANQDRRNLSNYIAIILEDHVNKKKTQNALLNKKNTHNEKN